MDRDVTYCVAKINTGCTAVMCNRTKLLLQIPPRERRKIKCDTKQPAGWLVDWRSRGRERTKRKQRIIWNISAMLSCRHPSWSDEIHKLVLNLCTIVYRISQLCQSWQLCPVAIFPFNRNIVFNETLDRTPSANLERSPFRVRWGYGQLTLTDRLSKDDRGLLFWWSVMTPNLVEVVSRRVPWQRVHPSRHYWIWQQILHRIRKNCSAWCIFMTWLSRPV